jgi:hypothetical protein
MLWTNAELLAAVAAAVFLFAATSKSRAFLSVESCAAHKGLTRCTPLLYRVKKFGQYLGDPLVVLLAVMLLPLSKNSLFGRCLGTSFERTIHWHTLLARWGLLLGSTVHGAVFLAVWLDDGTLGEHVWQDKVFWGVVALAMGLVIVATSLEFVRRQYYNVFRVVHCLAAPVFIYGVVRHYHGGEALAKLALPVLLLCADVALRVRGAKRRSWQLTELRSLGGDCDVVRITLRCSEAFHFQPGQYAFLNVAAVSVCELKPYTLLRPMAALTAAAAADAAEGGLSEDSTPASRRVLQDNRVVQVYVRPMRPGRWSARLAQLTQRALAATQPGEGRAAAEAEDEDGALLKSKEEGEWGGGAMGGCNSGGVESCGLAASVDGPYGTVSLRRPLRQYDAVLLFAGGIGCTPIFAVLQDLRTLRSARSWAVVWSVRERALLEEFAPRLRQAAADAKAAGCRLRVRIHLTCACAKEHPDGRACPEGCVEGGAFPMTPMGELEGGEGGGGGGTSGGAGAGVGASASAEENPETRRLWDAGVARLEAGRPNALASVGEAVQWIVQQEDARPGSSHPHPSAGLSSDAPNGPSNGPSNGNGNSARSRRTRRVACLACGPPAMSADFVSACAAEADSKGDLDLDTHVEAFEW